MDNQEFIADLAAILEIEPEEVHNELVLNNDNWNSLAIVSAIVLIDEHLGIAIEGDKLRACSSVGELLSLIQDAKSN